MNSKIIKGYIFEMDTMIATFQEYAAVGLSQQKETYTMLKDMRIRLIEESERAEMLERIKLLQEGKNTSRPLFRH